MDELADRLRMDPLAFRIKNLPEKAANAMWEDVLHDRREGVRLGQAARRRATRSPVRSRPAWAAPRTAGAVAAAGRARTATSWPTAASSMKCGTQDLGTGTRTIVTMGTAETLGLPVSAVKAGNRRHHLSVQRRLRRQHHDRGRDAGGSHDRGQGARCAGAKVGPALGVDAQTLTASNGRVHVIGNPSKGMAWKDACKLLGTEPISVDGEWVDGLSGNGTSGVQFTECRCRHRNRHRQDAAHPDRAGLRLDRRQAARRKPGLRRHRRVAELRHVRGPHPRSQHRRRWSTRTWSGT